MTSKPDVADAAIVFERFLGDAGWAADELTADTALQVFGAFAAESFATGSQADADGLLYQYGIYAFTGRDMFSLGLVRQFELVDDAGDHEGHVQFYCTLHDPPDAELRALGHHHQWWFHDSTTEPLHTWLGALQRRPEWSLLRHRTPSSVEIGIEHVCTAARSAGSTAPGRQREREIFRRLAEGIVPQ